MYCGREQKLMRGVRRLSASTPDRYLPWALLGGIGWFFVYADRAVLSPLLSTFGMQFHVGPGQLGLISSAFFLTYTLVQIPAGHLADRISPRALLGIGYIGFGTFIALTSAAFSYLGLLVLTAMAGAFQGSYYPTQFAVTARRIPAAALPVANAVITSGMGAGIAGGYLVAAVLAPHDWRIAVWVLGLLTIAVGVWLYLVTPSDVARSAGREPKARVLWNRRFVLLLAMNFCSLYPFFFLLAWLPFDISRQLDLHGLTLGALAALPTVVAIPATILWSRGAASRRLRRIRLLLAASALALLAMALPSGLPLLVAALVVYGSSGKLVLDPLLLSEVAQSLQGEQYGRAYGTLNFVGMLASVTAPALGGLLVQQFGNFSLAFVVAALMPALGFALSLALGPPGQVGPSPGTKRPTVAALGGGT